ncbi:MAG: hypothetical protein J6Y78_17045 [Paludibacteraceae bacterium]|nr:hypothetical protein [Paludibacteraceae bacterium]
MAEVVDKNKEASKKPLWNTKTARYVAFLDILGFKDYVLRNSLDDVYNRLSTLRGFCPEETDSTEKYQTEVAKTIKISIFSDSIIIFSIDDTYNSLFYFLSYVKKIMRMALRKEIPLKGAIAYGDVVIDSTLDIFCGQPIIDAYLLEEDLQYLGVVFHHTFEKPFSSLTLPRLNSISSWIKEKKTPFKYGERIHRNLDYRIAGKDTYNMTKFVKDQRLSSSGDARKYVDNTLSMLSAFQD